MTSRSALPFVVCSALIVAFFALIFRNAVNVPNGDDLYCLLLFTQEFQDAKTFAERLHLLIDQWVEHRIVYSRFTALLSYWLTSQVNFVVIVLIGNLTLVGFTVLFWKMIKKTGVSLYYLIPVVLTLFSPVTYEANLWAGASTVYMPVGFLGLLTVYLIVYSNTNKLSLILPLLAALLATYSFGNGMFAFAAGLAVLIYQRMFRTAAVWGLTGLVAIILYFRDFEAHSSTKAFSISNHFQEPLYLVYNMLAFVGGILDYSENSNAPLVAANIPALLLGLCLLLAVCGGCFLFLIKKSTEDPALKKLKVAWLGMAAFILITSLAMAYSRTLGAVMTTLSSRYKIYSMVFWILAYCGCLIHFRKKRLVGLSFGAASLLLLLFNYYTSYDKLSNYKSYMVSGLFNYNKNGHWVIYRNTSYYEGASKILSDSISRKSKPVYAFKTVFPQLTLEAIRNAPVLQNVKVSANEECDGPNDKCVSIHTDEYPSPPNHFEGTYLVVYNETNMYLFVADPVKNGRVNMLRTGDYFKKGIFMYNSLGSTLTPGSHYQLAVFCPTEKQQIRRIAFNLQG
ncbi:hypothetical protein [Dyadobacter aurulentus]|uniref:hypothetical protein n=1 Tax=Dyadobacter sp. UC 10 TaxID=2605428 RepID=UPI0011F1E5B5|nr:hypothetical protein [Dyadobacter sp. UC 10]KAA0993347.1 hypothetical protein FXO21_25795 [Dyadobacter sp. UC 10]